MTNNKRAISSMRITDELFRVVAHLYPGVAPASAIRTMAFTSGKARAAADDLGIDIDAELEKLKHGGKR